MSFEVFLATKAVRTLNREAGLDAFVLLVGTGLQHLAMNMEAITRQTRHAQLVTLNRYRVDTSSDNTIVDKCCPSPMCGLQGGRRPGRDGKAEGDKFILHCRLLLSRV